MQLFVRDLAGASHAISEWSDGWQGPPEWEQSLTSCIIAATSSHADLVNQVSSVLDLEGARLSYSSRTLTQDTFNTLPPSATVDVSMRLRGGGPKKRCAHVYVKTGTTPSTSGVNTPKPAVAAATSTATPAAETTATTAVEEKKEEDDTAQQQPPQPVVERCSSAALVRVHCHLPMFSTNVKCDSTAHDWRLPEMREIVLRCTSTP